LWPILTLTVAFGIALALAWRVLPP